MAKDDYFVIAYKILSYLYACLKSGEKADKEYLKCNTEQFPIVESYWNYIIENLSNDGFIRGISLARVCGQTEPSIRYTNIQITPKGIEYLENNSMMKKAFSMLKSAKEIIPGI